MHVSGGSILRKSQMCAVVQVGTQVELLLSINSILLSCLVPEQVISHQPLNPQLFFFLFSHARSSRPIQSNAVTHPPTQPGFGRARGASATHLPKHKTNRSIERHRSRVGVSCVAGSLNRFFRVSHGSVPRGSSWLGGLHHPILLPHTFAPHFCPTLSKNEESLGDPSFR